MAHRHKGEQKLVQKLFLSSSVEIYLLRVELASPREWSIDVFHLERYEREVLNRLGLVLPVRIHQLRFAGVPWRQGLLVSKSLCSANLRLTLNCRYHLRESNCKSITNEGLASPRSKRGDLMPERTIMMDYATSLGKDFTFFLIWHNGNYLRFCCRTSSLLVIKPALCGIKKRRHQKRTGCGMTFLSGGHQADLNSREYRQISREWSFFLALIKADICPSYPNLLSWNLGATQKQPTAPRVTDPPILCFGFTGWGENLKI